MACKARCQPAKKKNGDCANRKNIRPYIFAQGAVKKQCSLYIALVQALQTSNAVGVSYDGFSCDFNGHWAGLFAFFAIKTCLFTAFYLKRGGASKKAKERAIGAEVFAPEITYEDRQHSKAYNGCEGCCGGMNKEV